MDAASPNIVLSSFVIVCRWQIWDQLCNRPWRSGDVSREIWGRLLCTPLGCAVLCSVSLCCHLSRQKDTWTSSRWTIKSFIPVQNGFTAAAEGAMLYLIMMIITVIHSFSLSCFVGSSASLEYPVCQSTVNAVFKSYYYKVFKKILCTAPPGEGG